MNIKRAVLIGTLSAITITLIAIGIKTRSFNIENKTTTPIQHRQKIKSNAIQVDATETITDLTNYTITFKYTLNITEYHKYNITFNTSYGSLTALAVGTGVDGNGQYTLMDYYWNTDTYPIYYHSINNTTTWTTQEAMTITITGGTDVNNPQLITWLLNNSNLNNAYKPPNIENGNFISLQGLMLQILTMPFTFITQAFNVTLWPNTPYEFNISNFILSLIAIATILFIIKLFTSGFSIVGNYTNNEIKRQNIKADRRNAKQAEKTTKASVKTVKAQNKE